ncbi:MAG: 4-hydroxybutyrate--acetyl-CoA CoA transferase [Clostridia bacterium]|nr:acetyl-CoA hydrolase/transferase C-terminal domain-containing protein [Anaerotignum sp.]NCC16660.1 4-hydroxybutyrate--acetyl-CoA CoA transferase [Clostridia bacterium]
MNQFQGMYLAKKMAPEEVAKFVKSGDVCASPTGLEEPTAICEAIAKRAKNGELTGVVHHQTLSVKGGPFLNYEELKGKYDYVSWFTGGAGRKGIQLGHYTYVPNNYSTIPGYWRDVMPVLDVLYAEVSPMDDHGYFSCGMAGAEVVAMREKAKIILLDVNDKMPRVLGNNQIHISQVTALCESSRPLSILPSAPLTDVDRKIGQMIADEVVNGATLQLGIGGIPNAVGVLLQDKKDLGIHTEMLTDSMVDLIECGAVTNMKKPINVGKTVATLAWGSQKMYDYMNNNPAFEMHPVDYTNNPYIIGQHDNFVSVNACVEIDLFGQVCAESLGTKHYSGSGGQVDFVRGANLSKGGKGFIAMTSTTKGGTISKIKPTLTPGSIVTTTKNEVDFLVTENNIVRLKGQTASARAKMLISLAAPQFREELEFEAKKMNLII